MAGEVLLPGCKSFTNRALICAAYAQGVSRLEAASQSEDSRNMVLALRRVGVSIREEGPGLRVEGRGEAPRFSQVRLDVGEAGTVLRFLLAFLASGKGEAVIDGSRRIRQRPIGPLVDALRELGAEVDYLAETGFPPLGLRAHGLSGGTIRLSGDVSSQFASSLLLAEPYCGGRLEIVPTGSPVSRPYVEMTLGVRTAFGFPRDRVRGGYRSGEIRVPGDSSGAFTFLAAVALGGGEILVRGLGEDPVSRTLAGLGLPPHLGFQWRADPAGLRVSPAQLRPADLDLRDVPDLVPSLAVLLLFAPGTSRIRGVDHLRHKESDRLAALACELGRCGAQVRESPGGLEILGGRELHGAQLDTHGDHRLAMAFSLLPLRVPRVSLSETASVSKSYPGFWESLEGLFDRKARRVR